MPIAVRLAAGLLLVALMLSAGDLAPVPLFGAEPGPPVHTLASGNLTLEEEDEAVAVSVPVPTARAVRFQETGNWLWLFDQAWTLGVLGAITLSGLSARIRDLAHRIGRFWLPTVAIYIVLYTLLVFVIDLPLHYYMGFVRQHAYGLSNQSLSKWWGNAIKHLAVSAAVGVLVGWVPILLLARAPRRWWLYTTALTVPFLFVVVLVKPIWVDPLFNDFGPMKDRSLERQILRLAERAGIGGSRIYEVDKSVDTKAVNAYVTGLLGSKRIVLWDTLLDRLDHREVLAVMGHEMGHYVLGHVPRTILLSTLITLAAFFWVDRAGRWAIARFAPRFGFDRLSDVAAVPLILLLLQTATLGLGPVTNLYSRYQEHEADRFSLELTRMNRSTALAFAKLQHENLATPYPGWLHRIWRSTHPSIGERIEFCNEYRPWDHGGTLRYDHWFRP